MSIAAWVTRDRRTEERVSLHRTALLVVLVALTVTLPALAAADVVATLLLDPAELEFAEHDGYDVVTLRGARTTVQPGEPMLPLLDVRLLLPPDTAPSDLSVEYDGTVSIPGPFSILPAPRPVRYSSVEAVDDPHPNTEVYSSVLPYPTDVARLAGGSVSGGYSLASVLVTPIQYIPADGELLFHTRIVVRVATETRARRAPAVSSLSSAAGRAVANSVVNPEAFVGYEHLVSDRAGRGDLETAGVEYLIVCPAAFETAFEPLREWKTRKGVPAAIVTLDEIAANPSFDGRDEAEAVRNCISHYAATEGTQWVLLGGDTDYVPSRDAYDFFYDQGIPSDLYFADLDGDWNADGDDRWGENGDDDIDMMSDVFVGRAPVASEADVETFVQKVLEYEAAVSVPSIGHQTDVLFLGEILWDDPQPYSDGAVALEMVAEHFPPHFEPIARLYESSGTLTHGAAMSELQDGNGIIVHEGHANISTASIGPSSLTNADLDELINGARGGLWYSVGCWSAAIDYDTFGEHWLRNNAGGGALYVGNSRYGWGCPGYPGECVSDLYSQEFFAVLFGDGLTNAGAVHAEAKHAFVGIAHSDDYTRYAMYELNLLGDPELAIWTDAPAPLSVICPEAVPFESGWAEIPVEVAVDGSPVDAATVCLMTGDGRIYDVAETDGSGNVTLMVPEGDPVEATLTITARNAVPWTATVLLGENAMDAGDVAIGRTALGQNYPNPFNPRTQMAFSMAQPGRARLEIYDVNGRSVTVLVDGDLPAGEHVAVWDGTSESGAGVASGTYFARFTAQGQLFERKLVLMR